MAVVAYVLITTEVAKEHDVVKELLKINGVTEARMVYGDFDAVARLEVENLEALDQAISRIRRIRGLVRTITLVSTS